MLSSGLRSAATLTGAACLLTGSPVLHGGGGDGGGGGGEGGGGGGGGGGETAGWKLYGNVVLLKCSYDATATCYH